MWLDNLHILLRWRATQTTVILSLCKCSIYVNSSLILRRDRVVAGLLRMSNWVSLVSVCVTLMTRSLLICSDFIGEPMLTLMLTRLRTDRVLVCT